MDATKNHKTLSGVFVALLLGSVLATAVPVAAQSDPTNPTSAPDAFLSASEPSATALTLVSGGPLVFGGLYDITISNLTGINDDTIVSLNRPSGPSVGTQEAYPDGKNVGKFNVTFPSTQANFTEVGTWTISATGLSGAAQTQFSVVAQPNLQVTLSPTSFSYSESGGQTLTVNVVNLSSGLPAAGATLTLAGAPSATTNANGAHVFTGLNLAVGTHRVFAEQQYGTSGGAAEYAGNSTFTVSPLGLIVSGINTNVLQGFNTPASWNITYPTNSTGIISPAVGGANWLRYNLSVTLPNGTVVFANTTTRATSASQSLAGELRYYNATPGTYCGVGSCPIYQDGSGNLATLVLNTSAAHLTFLPLPVSATSGNWQSGTYSFNLKVNVKNRDGGDVFLPEYETSWSLAPSQPQGVNVIVREGATELKALSVRAATGFPTAPVAGRYTLFVDVTGNVFNQFPGSASAPELNAGWTCGGTTGNVTLTGDLLPGWSVTNYDCATGRATVSNVVPTDIGGTVNVNVLWKNVTTTTALPINVAGAKSTVDKSEIVVDQTSSLTVTLRDAFDNPVSVGQVFLMAEQAGLYAGIGSQSINGTGAPGLGQNGQYTFNVKPTAVGNLTVYGIIGSIEGGRDNRNYTYHTVRVAPAHDINVTLSKNSTMASLKTQLFVNATHSDGVGVPSSASAIYFLNATEVVNLQQNATLPSGARRVLFAPGITAGADVVDASWTAAGIHLNVTLGPGDYWVYVCSAWTGTDCRTAKHDNANNTPKFTANKYAATFTPARVADNPNIQNNTLVNVTIRDASGTPANGTLAISTGAAFLTTNPGTLTVTNGNTSFTATGAAVGDVMFAFDPSDNVAHSSVVDTAFVVTGPDVVVTPSRIPVGVRATLTVVSKSLSGQALAGKVIAVCGQPIGGAALPPQNISAGGTVGCTGNATTDASGTALVGLLPTVTGTLYLYVDGIRTTTTVPVFSGLQITIDPSSPVAGDTVRIKVTEIGSESASAGVAVTVRGPNATSNHTTDSAGMVVLSDVKEGNYTVTASKSLFENATLNFRVGPKPTTPAAPAAKFTLHDLTVPSTATVGTPITVTAAVHNEGNADGTAKVQVVVDGAVLETKDLFVPRDGEETVAFNFALTSAGAHRITVKIAGGEALADKTVNVATPSPTTPTGGTATTPTGGTATTPTGGTDTTTTPTPSVPGFEVVALLAALGVALLVLRRK